MTVALKTNTNVFRQKINKGFDFINGISNENIFLVYINYCPDV